MEANINLFKQSWLIQKKVQRRITIFLMIIVVVFSSIYLHSFKKFSVVSSNINLRSDLILSSEERRELIQLRAQFYEQEKQPQDKKSLVYWDKLITKLLVGIAKVESLTFVDLTWVIKGELKAYSDFQVLTERAANLRSQEIKISVNKVGPLNQGQFILTLQGEE